MNLAQKLTSELALALSTLEALAITTAYTPEYADLAVRSAFRSLGDEVAAAAARAALRAAALIDPPGGDDFFYPGDPGGAETASDALEVMIRKCARGRVAPPPRLPPSDPAKVTALARIALLARERKDPRLYGEAVTLLFTHPETLPYAFSIAEEIAWAESGVSWKSALKKTSWRGGGPRATRKLHPQAIAAALKALCDEELACVSDRAEGGRVTPEAPFVLPLGELGHAYSIFRDPDAPRRRVPLFAADEAARNLDVYLGGYLEHLDLSRSYITGSAALSSALRPGRRLAFDSHADYLSVYYPDRYTSFDSPRAFAALATASVDERLNGERTPPFLVFEGERPAVSPPGTEDRFTFSTRPGSDVDIVVDAEGEEFEEVARSHLGAVRRRFPDAVLVRVDREKSPLYRIDPGPVRPEGFREVEIYPGSWAKIMTHHVGMARLAYTAAGAEAPRFLLAASCALSAAVGGSVNYYYFCSRKTTPQEIILKYVARGFRSLACLPPAVHLAILLYAHNSSAWNLRQEGFGSLCGLRNGKLWFYAGRYISPALNASGLYNARAVNAEVRAYLRRLQLKSGEASGPEAAAEAPVDEAPDDEAPDDEVPDGEADEAPEAAAEPPEATAEAPEVAAEAPDDGAEDEPSEECPDLDSEDSEATSDA